jgi:hypothetical protein
VVVDVVQSRIPVETLVGLPIELVHRFLHFRRSPAGERSECIISDLVDA